MAMKLLSKLKDRREDHEWDVQAKCHLLQLPGELRNRIYHLVLLGEEDEDEDDKKPIELCKLRWPALTATCRQLRFESLSYFFRYGAFSYTIVLDNKLKLHTSVSRRTTKWFKSSKVSNFTIHSVTFQFLCLDLDALFDHPADKWPPLQLLPLFRIEDGELFALLEDDEEEDSRHKLSKRNEARAEQARIEIDELVTKGICLGDAERVGILIAKAGRLRRLQYACKSLVGVFNVVDRVDRVLKRLRKGGAVVKDLIDILRFK